MRSAVLCFCALVLAFVLAACDAGGATAEYARAKAAYQAAMAETRDVTYKGPRWDEVIALLRAVPASNAHEHKLAQALVKDIEQTRSRLAQDLRASDVVAGQLLDLQSFPPIEPPPPPPPPTERERMAVRDTCVAACTSSFMACMASSGCKTTTSTTTAVGTKSQYDCPGEASRKGMACKDAVNACGAKCQ